TTYHFHLVATNSSGLSSGTDATFTTPGVLTPTVTTLDVDLSTANPTMNASINPNGAATTYYFEYGQTTNYGASTTAGNLSATDSVQSVNAAFPGAVAGGTYHYRSVAST